MPVGVPKVPYLIPKVADDEEEEEKEKEKEKEEEAAWVDLFNRVYRQRFLFLCQEITAELGNQVVGLIVHLSIDNSTQDQYLYINSPGGWVIPGAAVHDTIKWVTPDVHTICIGISASIASFVLAGGPSTKRAAFPHSKIMIHQPIPVSNKELEQILDIRHSIINAYVKDTGQPFWIISEDLGRDVFMSPTEAILYGLIDEIVSPTTDIGFNQDEGDEYEGDEYEGDEYEGDEYEGDE